MQLALCLAHGKPAFVETPGVLSRSTQRAAWERAPLTLRTGLFDEEVECKEYSVIRWAVFIVRNLTVASHSKWVPRREGKGQDTHETLKEEKDSLPADVERGGDGRQSAGEDGLCQLHRMENLSLE